MSIRKVFLKNIILGVFFISAKEIVIGQELNVEKNQTVSSSITKLNLKKEESNDFNISLYKRLEIEEDLDSNTPYSEENLEEFSEEDLEESPNASKFETKIPGSPNFKQHTLKRPRKFSEEEVELISEIEILHNKIKEMQSIVEQLNEKNKILNDIIYEQEEAIENLKKENKNLSKNLQQTSDKLLTVLDEKRQLAEKLKIRRLETQPKKTN